MAPRTCAACGRALGSNADCISCRDAAASTLAREAEDITPSSVPGDVPAWDVPACDGPIGAATAGAGPGMAGGTAEAAGAGCGGAAWGAKATGGTTGA